MRVVHIKREPAATYVGRAMPKHNLKGSKWGNPVYVDRTKAGDESYRQVLLLRYAMHLQRKKLYADIEELRGQDLGCWCAPKSCHADVLLYILESQLSPQKALQAYIKEATFGLTQVLVGKVAVSGSRRMASASLVAQSIEALPVSPSAILQGECPYGGADALAKAYAEQHGISCDSYPPFDRKPSAFARRNRMMADDCHAFVALWDGKVDRSGTLNFARYAWQSERWIVWVEWVKDDVIKQVFFGVRLSMMGAS